MQTRIKQLGKSLFVVEYQDIVTTSTGIVPTDKWRHYKSAISLDQARGYRDDLNQFGINGVVVE